MLIDVLRFEFYLRLQSICCDDDFTRYFCMWFAVFADFDEFVKWKRTVFCANSESKLKKESSNSFCQLNDTLLFYLCYVITFVSIRPRVCHLNINVM